MLRIIAIVVAVQIAGFAAMAKENRPIVVGAKTFTEQFLLGHLITLVLQQEGYVVEEQFNITTRVLRGMLMRGEVDIYWEYTGTAYGALFRGNDPLIYSHADKLYQTVRHMDAKNGVRWLTPSQFDNGWRLVVLQKGNELVQARTISELAQLLNQGKKLIFGINPDFYERPDGFKKLAQYYGFSVPPQQIKLMTHQSVYAALARGQIEVGMGYGTDPLERKQALSLEDDQKFFPLYIPAPTVRESFAQSNPQIVELVNQLGPYLSQSKITEMITAVDLDEIPYQVVARRWLQHHDFLP